MPYISSVLVGSCAVYEGTVLVAVGGRRQVENSVGSRADGRAESSRGAARRREGLFAAIPLPNLWDPDDRQAGKSFPEKALPSFTRAAAEQR